ncbi:unnamed protein product, partial [Onchocerca ochengi]
MIDAVNRVFSCFNRFISDDDEGTEEKVHVEKYIFKSDPLNNLILTLDTANFDKRQVDNAFPRFLVCLDAKK